MMAAVPYQPRRLAKSNPWPAVLACAVLLFAVVLGIVLGHNLAAPSTVDKPLEPINTPPPAAPAETPEPVRHRDDIVSDGRLLAYDLQEIMQ